ncbi:LuxR family transcriptional regulator [Jiangella asiatica]|uniref:LuxR family transcriptional regulator n=1 Tax=Jiangella asiatica TaxID=2530372 RepID=A0A4R5DV31_9ACTN|nr:LuxR family transcriptional regulator [Jiangella asiatica]TDE15085.1 LuxR family transcriptional regulator [Jiangella asiatica]
MNARDLVAAGEDALAAGDWPAARDAFGLEWDASESVEALDGLGRALWWLGDPGEALDVRARAFAQLRRAHRDSTAAAVAIWISRQYRNLYHRDAMADGWLTRAKSLLAGLDDAASMAGWIALAESEAAEPGPRASTAADRAVAIARYQGDVDLEIVALARRGALSVATGQLAPGLSDLNEAMVAATSGEGEDVQYVGEALCTLLEVAGWLGDRQTVEPWAQLIIDFRSSYAFGPLVPLEASATDLISAFCTGCCGGVYLVTGRLDAAEQQLADAVSVMATTGVRPRCLHPVAQLVELRVLQGRLAEAEVLLTGYDEEWECAVAGAGLDLALGRPAQAVRRLREALDGLAQVPVLALPVHAQLVEAALANDDDTSARASAGAIDEVATMTGSRLHRAQSELARGRVALAGADTEAPGLLRSAARGFAAYGVPLLACRARMALAHSLVTTDRGVAITEARSALQAFDRMGAAADADRAAAFLRELGVRGRTGARGVGVLSQREKEVLALVTDGLTNAEIAERLFISQKTAGNHVGNILTKLGVRSRTEAAAFALLHLGPRR